MNPSDTHSAGDNPATHTGQPEGAGRGSLKERSRQTIRDQAETARQKAEEVKAEVKGRTGSAARDLRQSGEDLVSSKKEQAANRIDRYGQELNDAAQSFEADDPNIAWFTHRVADRISGFADHVRERDFRTLWNEAEDVARRHPLAVVGGLFAAGLAMGTFVRAARDDREAYEFERDDLQGGEGRSTEAEDWSAPVGSDSPDFRR